MPTVSLLVVSVLAACAATATTASLRHRVLSLLQETRLPDSANGTQDEEEELLGEHDDQYDSRRPDMDIIGRTLEIEEGKAKPGSAEAYPLVTSTFFDGAAFTFSDFPVTLQTVPVKDVQPNVCAAGGPVLVGVMSTADDRHGRDRQRRMHRRFGDIELPPICASIVYAIGVEGLSPEAMKMLADEQAQVGDLVYLHIKENMNEGKSYEWFNFAFNHYPSAVYIAKSDVDAFVHPEHLVEQLGRLPNQQLLYGFDCEINNRRSYIGGTRKVGADMVPLPATGGGHMAGSFYTFSRDLLACSLPTAAAFKEGAEDAVSSSWPLLANCSHFFAADMFRFFDHESRRSKHNRWWQHLGWNNKPVLVHFLKEDPLWEEVGEWLCKKNGVCEQF